MIGMCVCRPWSQFQEKCWYWQMQSQSCDVSLQAAIPFWAACYIHGKGSFMPEVCSDSSAGNTVPSGKPIQCQWSRYTHCLVWCDNCLLCVQKWCPVQFSLCSHCFTNMTALSLIEFISVMCIIKLTSCEWPIALIRINSFKFTSRYVLPCQPSSLALKMADKARCVC
jgi:hypothetical protein